jgi:hypothetical protein
MGRVTEDLGAWSGHQPTSCGRLQVHEAASTDTTARAFVFDNLIYRVVGSPPASGASRVERLRWVRKFYRFNLVAIAMVVVFALLGWGTFWWVAAAVIAVIWLIGWASISMQIRREASGGR